jgi:TonB family protein
MKIRQILFILTLFSSFILAQSGFVYTYYSSGEVEGVLFYVNDVLDGKSYWYHENGNLKAEKNYSNGKLNGLSKDFYDTGLMKQEISTKFGVRDGITKNYYENGALKSILSYEKGVLIKEVNIENDPFYVAPLDAYKYANTQDRIKDNEDLFLCEGADICPKPVGGMNEILKHLIYPEHAKLYGLEGFVTVVVSVNEIGIPTDISVLKDLGLGTKEAAIEAVKNSRFLPGEKDGVQVASKLLFKIPFLLNNKILFATPSTKKPEQKIEVVKNNASKKVSIDSSLVLEKIVEPKNFDCDLEVCAKPKEGIKGILDNFVMPTMVKRKGIEGEVTVEAEVDEYGNVRDTKVINEIGYGCDIAVEVAILQTLFEPAISNGKAVRSTVKIRVPIVQKKE